MTIQHSDTLIIGAGLSGLMAATKLVDSGRSVTLIDKGNSVGGRLATRRIDKGRADHGAQFFSVRSDEFQNYVERWLAAGLVYPWSSGWSDGSTADSPNDGHPRYVTTGGMSTLAKHLASELQSHGAMIHTGMKATRIGQRGAGWQVETEQQAIYSAPTLVVTSPVPQSLTLLDAGNVHLMQHDRAALEAIRYDPCLCALVWVEGEVYLPEPGALQRPQATISWIADNRRKGISPDLTLLTMHANGEFSRANYDKSDDEVALTFLEALIPLLDSHAAIRETQIKRWRYSIPTVLHHERFLRAADLPPLYFAGDAFGSPRIEGAALSGLAIGEAIRDS